jgi:site-specific DNA recombinase
MRAAVYLRVSQDRTGEELGIARQREDAHALAERRGWTIAGEHVDNDTSAAGKRRRPGFEALMADVTGRRADAVIAWDMTRLLRTARDRLRMLEEGKKAGTVLAFVRGSDLDLSTPAGRLTADILGSVAQHEIDQKSDRQKRANLQAARAGKRVGGRRPFGYEDDGVRVRPGEAQAIRDGYEALLQGASLSAIAREWNARGLTTGQGDRAEGKPSPWRQDAVRHVLLNGRYAGRRVLGGEIVGPAVWEALVSEDTYEAAAALLADPTRRNPPGSDVALLTGLALCGVCGAPVHGGRTRRKVRTYRCKGAYGHVSRQADPVDEFVEAVIVARLARPDAAELLTERTKVDVKPLRAERQAIRERQEALEADYALAKLSRAALERARAATTARLADLDAALADTGRVDVLGPLVTADDVAATWEGLPIERRRGVVDVLAVVTLHPPGRGRRTFDPDTVDITWRTT